MLQRRISLKYFRKVAKKVTFFERPPASSAPGRSLVPRFQKFMRKGSAPRGRGWKTRPFWYPGIAYRRAHKHSFFSVGAVSSPPENLPFLRRGGTLGRPKAFPLGPTPLIKGRWPKARGDRVRCPRRGRMRGQGSDSSVFRRGYFAAISALRAAAGAAVALRNAPAGAVRAATYFAHGGKVGKTPPGTHPMGYGSA